MKLGILTEPNGWEKHYIKACKELKVDYEVIDIVSTDWWENIKSSKVDGFLVRAAGDNPIRKELYDERLLFIDEYCEVPLYPPLKANLLYENKRMQHYWMKINNIKHPKTWVFYTKSEARKFIKQHTEWPIISKPNLGGQGRGVKLLKSRSSAKRLIKRVFTRWGFYNKGKLVWKKRAFGLRTPLMDQRQQNYLYLQEFLEDIKWEWRIIRVGDTYFGHQKLEKNGKHSGSGLVGHVDPPKELLKETKRISDLLGSRSLNIDFLEDENGEYWVNEIQTYWGGRKNYQMKINGESCRYIEKADGEFVLEYGLFHQNRGCNLRVKDFVDQLNTNRQLAL